MTGDTPARKLLDALARATSKVPKAVDHGWQCRCPAHDDRHPSLSFTEGHDGRVLLKCHAGCSTEAVCAALGLTVADLFVPSTAPTSTNSPVSNGNGEKRRRRQEDGQRPAFATAD